jgi:hypothetical protein
VLDVIAGLRDQLVETAGLSDALIDGVVVGVPGVVDEESGRIELATSVEGLEGIAFRPALRERLELPVTLENDVNLAALGEQWQGVARGVDDFVFLSIGTGMGAGLVLHGELHRGRHGAAGEVDFALVGLAQDVDPCAGAISTYATRVAAERSPVTTLQAPFDSREIFAAARSGTLLRTRSSRRSRDGLHCTSSRSPLSATSRSRSWAVGWERTATSCSGRSASSSPAGSRTRLRSTSPAWARPRSSREHSRSAFVPRSTTCSSGVHVARLGEPRRLRQTGRHERSRGRLLLW